MLTIENMKLSDIKPYRLNAKKHPKEQIEQIKQSIREFGFDDPIAVWGPDNTIVEGHGRYIAGKELGMTEIPVIRLDHLTDEQRRAYTLVHNQLTMNTGFDLTTLNIELDAIPNLDLTVYGLDLIGGEEENDEGKEERGFDDTEERSCNRMNLTDFDDERCVGFYQIPTLKACGHVPKSLMKFDNIMTEKSRDRKDAGIHFFMHDTRFERLWEAPQIYLPKLAEYDCVLTPDFSLYMDMPMAMKIWNVYRGRLLGQMMQDYGMKVIPTLVWAEPETYDFCFDGIEQGGTVATSTVGVMRNKEAQAVWKDGMKHAIEKIRPKNIIVYGYKEIPDFDSKGANVVHIMADRFDV